MRGALRAALLAAGALGLLPTCVIEYPIDEPRSGRVDASARDARRDADVVNRCGVEIARGGVIPIAPAAMGVEPAVLVHDVLWQGARWVALVESDSFGLALQALSEGGAPLEPVRPFVAAPAHPLERASLLAASSGVVAVTVESVGEGRALVLRHFDAALALRPQATRTIPLPAPEGAATPVTLAAASAGAFTAVFTQDQSGTPTLAVVPDASGGASAAPLAVTLPALESGALGARPGRPLVATAAPGFGAAVRTLCGGAPCLRLFRFGADGGGAAALLDAPVDPRLVAVGTFGGRTLAAVSDGTSVGVVEPPAASVRWFWSQGAGRVVDLDLLALDDQESLVAWTTAGRAAVHLALPAIPADIALATEDDPAALVTARQRVRLASGRPGTVGIFVSGAGNPSYFRLFCALTRGAR